MSRRNEWKQVQSNMLSEATRTKTVEEREKIPEKACGVCKNFLENAYSSDGRGSCRVLKTGSNITASPPVYVTEGDTGHITFFNADGGQCTHFLKMDLIDKDGTECADPVYRRMQRQMERAGK